MRKEWIFFGLWWGLEKVKVEKWEKSETFMAVVGPWKSESEKIRETNKTFLAVVGPWKSESENFFAVVSPFDCEKFKSVKYVKN